MVEARERDELLSWEPCRRERERRGRKGQREKGRRGGTGEEQGEIEREDDALKYTAAQFQKPYIQLLYVLGTETNPETIRINTKNAE